MPCSNPRIQRCAALALLALFGLLLGAQGVTAQHGCPGDNLAPNCDFTDFTGSPPRQVPAGWNAFVLSGQVGFQAVHGSESHSLYGSSSLRLDSGDAFVAGIYAQVGGVEPGRAYRASIGWGAPTAPASAFGRQLGIDPTGGTDPNASSVVWGPVRWGNGRMLNYPPPDVNIDVSAVAQSSTVTIFVKVDHNQPTAGALVFLDAVSLVLDPNQPPPPPPTAVPTATEVKAVAVAAVQASPTRRPTSTASPTVTVTNTPLPTLTPTVTPTPTETPTPTATFTPQPTATATFPARPRATVGTVAPVVPQAPVGAAPAGLLWGGLGALGGAGVMGAALAMVRRK